MEPREIHWEPQSLARLIDDAPLAIYVKDARGRISYVNEACASALGRPVDELVGLHEEEVFPKSVLGRMQRNDRWVLRHGRQLDTEELLPLPNGVDRTFLTHRVPMRSASGETVAVASYSMEITERKAIEEHLRRREASLAEAQQIAGVGSWSWDVEPDEVRWSDEMHRIAGVSAESFRPTFAAWLALVDDADRERVLAASEASLAGRRAYEVRHRLRRPTGEVRVVHCRGEVKRAPDGSPVRFHGTCMDVTEAAQTQERLRRSQARLAEAQRLARLGGFEWDYDMDVLSWSDEVARILGHDPDTVPPEPRLLLDALPAVDRERLQVAVQQALDSGGRFDLEVRVERPDGRERRVFLTGRATSGERGERTLISGVAQDVTGRSGEAERLRTDLGLLASTFDALPVAAGAVDRTGQWLTANPRMQELTGRDADDLTARTLASLVPAAERDRHDECFDDLKRGRADEATCRFCAERPDGGSIDVEARLVAVRDAEGALEHVVVTARDVTADRHVERLRAARLRLAELVADGGEVTTLLEVAASAAGARAARLWLRETAESPLRLAAGWSAHVPDPEDWDDRPVLEPEAGPAVIEALVIDAPVDLPLEGGGRAQAVPLAGGGEVMGAVEVEHRGRVQLDEPSRELLEALARHAGQVVLRRRSEDDLRHRALHDPLTGLPNRALLSDRLEQALARMGREHTAAALLFIDCDDFKLVNDNHGHAAGDDALRAVAAHIAALIRPGDTLARVGGDEFVVLAERVVGTVEAVSLCERILRDVVVPVGPDGEPLRLTLSVGACLFDGSAGTVADVLGSADAAMYEAKTAGGDRCRIVRRVQ